jgi:hypothetical protein
MALVFYAGKARKGTAIMMRDERRRIEGQRALNE